MSSTTDIEQRLLEAETERDALKAYARKATATITELHGGGSECFAGKIGDMYVADLDFCKQRIRERESKAHIRFVDVTKQLRAARSNLEEAEGALEPFAEAGKAMLLTGGKNPKLSGHRLAEHLECARRTLASLREADHA